MEVVAQVSVLFFLILLGYLCAKLKVTGPEASACFSPFILKISLPCLLLTAFQRPFSAELLGEAGAAAAASLLMYAIAIPLACVYPRLLRMRGPERGVHRYAIMFTNCGFIGYPMVGAILGPEYIFHASVFNILFSFLAYSVGAWIIAREGERTAPLSWRTFINPSVIATALGFLFFLFSFSLPAPLFKSIKMLGDVTSPLSMIVIGINLAQADAGQVWGRWKIYVTVALRLIVLPLIVALGCRLLRISGPLTILAMALTAMPAASTTSIMASACNVAAEEGSALVFISTLFSMATIPLMIAALGWLHIV